MSISKENGCGEPIGSNNVATTSAVTLDRPAPQKAPNGTLVDELMNARRDRYRQVRLTHGSDGCHTFPVQSSKGADSKADRHPSTAPAQIGLLGGIPLEGGDEGNEKLQGQSTAHLLLRLLALSYVVPMCDASDAGLPGES